ncbi:unnamed protein product [[Candida] boidinii]|uniref:Unnamed protein product n=1 Tax=Candida boidinii TaxID=5477 RepID=A0ACB5TPY0_CANBO|nr:unnamed protein product [[Candida] boidinii]GME93036.1 unnamed protein product [[Candida] boidinii]
MSSGNGIHVDPSNDHENFYIRYYSGHKGDFGHEFLEFDIKCNTDDDRGYLRYTNNSNYRREELIRKQVCISKLVIKEIKKMIQDCEILKEKDTEWPKVNSDGKQELEIRSGRDKLVFTTCKLGSMAEIRKTNDPEGLRIFYYFIQDLKALIFSLMSLHFKIKPI